MGPSVQAQVLTVIYCIISGTSGHWSGKQFPISRNCTISGTSGYWSGKQFPVSRKESFDTGLRPQTSVLKPKALALKPLTSNLKPQTLSLSPQPSALSSQPSIMMVFFSGTFAASFLGTVSFRTPSSNLALISSSVTLRPTKKLLCMEPA